jgi:hypothetical protein
MKNFLSKASVLTSIIDSSSIKDYLDKKIDDVNEYKNIAKDTLATGTTKSIELIQNSIDNDSLDAIVDKAKNIADISAEEVKKYSDKFAAAIQDVQVSTSTDDNGHIKNAISKLEGKDKIGLVGEGLATLGGAAAGVAAAGTVASAAGASTLLGSTTLASALGGVFVTSTPIGWVIGSAAIAGAAGYGIAKLVRSGSAQDQVREDLIKRFKERLNRLEADNVNKSPLSELRDILPSIVEQQLISEEQAERMIALIENGKLDAKIALNRLNSIKNKQSLAVN